MIERPRGITVIASVDGLTGILTLLLGLLSTGLIPSLDIAAFMAQLLPAFHWDYSIMMAFGIICVVGALGIVRMSAWGYFMTMLVRFLSIMFLIIAYSNYYFALLLIPEMVIIVYLIRLRGFFFEPVISPVGKASDEPNIPELPTTLTMPTEEDARAKEIQKVLSTPKPTPRICPQCGEQNPLDAVICSHCGGHLEATSKGPTSSKKAKKAPNDGPMVFCIYCGTKNGAEAEYCFRCGKKMWKT